MPLSQHLNQISAFAARADVEQYLVGITANVTSRRKSYYGIGFDYFEVLSSGHTREQAVEIERALFEKLTTDTTLRAKYHFEKRDKPYRPSTGGKTSDTYSVYVAGFAP